MGKQKMIATSLSLSTIKIPQAATRSSVAVPGEGGRVLVILDCAMLAGSDQNAAWLHDLMYGFSPAVPSHLPVVPEPCCGSSLHYQPLCSPPPQPLNPKPR